MAAYSCHTSHSCVTAILATAYQYLASQFCCQYQPGLSVMKLEAGGLP
jgi:hypothetical protein